MKNQSKPQNLWNTFGTSLVVFLVFGMTVACQMFVGSQGVEDLGAVRMESAEGIPFAGMAKALVYSKGGDSLIVGGCQNGGSKNDNLCATGLVQVWNFKGNSSATTRTLPRGVTALAMSPDGSKWVAGDAEGRLIVSTTKSVPNAFHQKTEITALAFSPDGRWVASGSLDPTFPLGLMDITTGGVIKVKARFEPVAALAFSPDGKTLAVGMTRGGVALWNFTSSSSPEAVAGSFIGAAVTSIAFSSDGELLSYGTEDGRVVILNRGSEQITAEYKGASAVNALAFSPDGQLLALGQDNGKVLLIDSGRAKQVWGKRHVLPVSDLAFSPDGTSLAVASQQNVFMYRLGEGEAVPGAASRSERSAGLRMKEQVLPEFRKAAAPSASSRRFARVMQIAQDEYMWLLPFNRLTTSAVQAMLKVVPGATSESAGGASSERLVLNAGGRSLSLDLGKLRQAEGREGPREAVRAYESAQRFLLASNPAAAAELEDAAIQGVLAELGPGLRMVPWPTEAKAVRASDGPQTAPMNSMLPGGDQGGDRIPQAGRMAYFKLTKFSKLTAGQVQQWLAKRSESQRQADAAVLDLRDNPGADLESAIATAKSLVPSGHLITGVIVRKNGDRVEFRSDNTRHRPRSLVVLVNERTTGTAEMLACAIRASGAGVLVGVRTAGVDEVYTTFQLPGGEGLRVSTGRFLCPDERSVRWEGHAVDVEVGQTPPANVMPIGVSPVGPSHRPRLANQLGTGLPVTWDRQLRVGIDLAFCLGQAHIGDLSGRQEAKQSHDAASLLSACR